MAPPGMHPEIRPATLVVELLVKDDFLIVTYFAACLAVTLLATAANALSDGRITC